MTSRKVVRRRRARLDLEEAAFWYAAEAGNAVAERFLLAVEAAIGRLAAHLAAGSLRYADTMAHPGLRFWRVKGFPWRVFYVDRGGWIDVWRLLHAGRDIPAWLFPED